MRIQPYLMFDGNCEDAFRFYETVLGGRITMLSRFGEMPSEAAGSDGCVDTTAAMPADFAHKIMHARLEIGDQVLMGSDNHPMYPCKGIHGVSIALGFTDATEADRIFAALAEGATVTMPIAETFWAERFGMLTDQFGVPWMINGAEKN